MNTLSLSLQITLIGMTLVFGSIVVLWIVMSILVKLTPDRGEAKTDRAAIERERKQRAAAIAVAFALADETTPQLHEFPLPPTAIVSAWQSVMRGRQLGQRGPRQR